MLRFLRRLISWLRAPLSNAPEPTEDAVDDDLLDAWLDDDGIGTTGL